jgi:hypothetical protein
LSNGVKDSLLLPSDSKTVCKDVGLKINNFNEISSFSEIDNKINPA